MEIHIDPPQKKSKKIKKKFHPKTKWPPKQKWPPKTKLRITQSIFKLQAPDFAW